MKFIIIPFISIFFSLATHSQKNVHPTSIIFDSDMGPDYDDVGAIALLHHYADSGKVKILATIASTKYKNVAAIFNVLNTYFKRPGIPIAVPKGNASELRDWQHWSDTLVLNYPHAIKSNEEVPDAVELYRKILSGQPDWSVTIISVGFLTNLANLLKSAPDQYSRLNGIELVKRKVAKLVCMGGWFPSGKEFNLSTDATASSYVFENWEPHIIFSGVEIGKEIRTGIPLTKNESIRNSPVKDVFRICIPMAAEDSLGRMSWDETAVMVGVIGYSPWFDLHKGKIIFHQDGKNEWEERGNSHSYLVFKVSAKEVENHINHALNFQ